MMLTDVAIGGGVTGIMAVAHHGNRSSGVIWWAGLAVILAVGVVIRVLGQKYRNRDGG